MKTTIKSFSLCGIFTAALFMYAACDEDAIIRDSYTLILPDLPEAWLVVLGEPYWHIEWVNKEGSVQSAEIYPGANASAAEIMQEWTTPVTAWPYWPEKGLKYGIMKPAGALFPLDVSGGRVNLSWNGGIDAVFYRELAAINSEKRLPHQFNWVRFRELFQGADLPEEILKDPWLADWKSIAVKTAASGFDHRRINVQKYSTLSLAIPADGPWISSSPFMRVSDWKLRQSVVIKITEQAVSYFCPQGILRCSSGAWMWITYSRNQ
jgi:hypothetical protein